MFITVTISKYNHIKIVLHAHFLLDNGTFVGYTKYSLQNTRFGNINNKYIIKLLKLTTSFANCVIPPIKIVLYNFSSV